MNSTHSNSKPLIHTIVKAVNTVWHSAAYMYIRRHINIRSDSYERLWGGGGLRGLGRSVGPLSILSLLMVLLQLPLPVLLMLFCPLLESLLMYDG